MPRTTKQPEHHEQNDNKYIPTKNHFTCKWTKLSNKKTEWLNGLKKKKRHTLPKLDSV